MWWGAGRHPVGAMDSNRDPETPGHYLVQFTSGVKVVEEDFDDPQLTREVRGKTVPYRHHKGT